MFNQIVHHKKNHVHSWIVMISDLCCCTLTLILNGHHSCMFCFHGNEFKCIVIFILFLNSFVFDVAYFISNVFIPKKMCISLDNRGQ